MQSPFGGANQEIVTGKAVARCVQYDPNNMTSSSSLCETGQDRGITGLCSLIRSHFKSIPPNFNLCPHYLSTRNSFSSPWARSPAPPSPPSLWSTLWLPRVLSELILQQRIRLDQNRKKNPLVDVVDRASTGDEVIDEALGKIRSAKRRASLNTWIERIAGIKQLKHRTASGFVRQGDPSIGKGEGALDLRPEDLPRT